MRQEWCENHCDSSTNKKMICLENNNNNNINNNKNNKNIFNKNEGRCRDVKTQKACEQGWEVNVGPKIKQTTSI